MYLTVTNVARMAHLRMLAPAAYCQVSACCIPLPSSDSCGKTFGRTTLVKGGGGGNADRRNNNNYTTTLGDTTDYTKVSNYMAKLLKYSLGLG